MAENRSNILFNVIIFWMVGGSDYMDYLKRLPTYYRIFSERKAVILAGLLILFGRAKMI